MKQALIDPERCRPENCLGGRCVARQSCPTRAIRQEEAFEVPLTDPQRCRSCSKCLTSCPLSAISLA